MAAIDIRHYNVTGQDSFFFDTNIWLYIFGPMAGTNATKQSVYSNFYKEVLSRDAKIFISSLVISEYINRVLRIGFSQWKDINHNSQPLDFKKDYRPTQDYKDQLDEAIAQAKDILNFTQPISDSFQSCNLQRIFDRMKRGCDYNDSYIFTLCFDHYKLVTDDQDMLNIAPSLDIIIDKRL